MNNRLYISVNGTSFGPRTK